MHPCPTTATRDAALAAHSIFQGEQIPAYLAASPFLQKQAVLAGELGATSWIPSKKPGHKATGRSIKEINFLGSYRPSGNNSILISAFPCAREKCRQHPQSHTFPKHLFPRTSPGNSTGITIRYCNIISQNLHVLKKNTGNLMVLLCL